MFVGLAVPEDLVIVPGTDWVVAGAYSEESTRGSVSGRCPKQECLRALFPTRRAEAA